ncbi:hypothetical protein ACJMK2_035106 [Sinanodonta woodiana]|uniref:Uncharacterized protein n=1 Tax=Sinanodonta woodiana TaxID=1069815 RepID=A0ABD3WV41_SINWO
MISVIVVVAVVWLCSGGQVWGKVVQNDDGSGTISFQTPTLSDEEYHSIHIPSHLKCDACNALAYQVSMLKTMCYQYLEEFGDEVIYKEYLKHKNLRQFFCKNVKKPGLTDACLSEHEKTRNKTEHEKRRKDEL